MEDKRLKSALEVLSVLNENGYEAYLVGGFVRDYLLGTEGKDIDITTNALPQKVQELFPSNFSKSLLFTSSFRLDETLDSGCLWSLYLLSIL